MAEKLWKNILPDKNKELDAFIIENIENAKIKKKNRNAEGIGNG